MKTAAIGAGPRTARKLAPVLERTIFRTSRLAEFCSTRELVAQTRVFQAQDGYDRRDSEQQQVTADEDRGRLVRRP